jgi:cytosine permease
MFPVPVSGLYSSTGMFLGHYVSWICAGIMGAAASVVLAKPLTQLDSGSVATTALGSLGALAVVIAGTIVVMERVLPASVHESL